jgi:hypothetical protein
LPPAGLATAGAVPARVIASAAVPTSAMVRVVVFVIGSTSG